MDKQRSLHIQHVVAQNTPQVGVPSLETQLLLTKYLSNPETKDIVYLNVVQRLDKYGKHFGGQGGGDATPSGVGGGGSGGDGAGMHDNLVVLCLRLIKQNLSKYGTTVSLLVALDNALRRIEVNNQQLSKSILYVRIFIHREIKLLESAGKRRVPSTAARSTRRQVFADAQGGGGSAASPASQISPRRRSEAYQSESSFDKGDAHTGALYDIDDEARADTELDGGGDGDDSGGRSLETSWDDSNVAGGAGSADRAADGGAGGDGDGGAMHDGAGASADHHDVGSESGEEAGAADDGEHARNSALKKIHADMMTSMQRMDPSLAMLNKGASINSLSISIAVMPVDVLATRLTRKKLELVKGCGPLHATLLFGGQFKPHDVLGPKQGGGGGGGGRDDALDGGRTGRVGVGALLASRGGGGVVSFENDEAMAKQIKHVVASKKEEEQEKYKQSHEAVFRRRGGQLFQYRHYDEQSALVLSKSQFDAVTAAVVHPPQKKYESRLIGSKILIKYWMDKLCASSPIAADMILSLMFEMLESSDVDTRVHSFNLLCNLLIHVSLYTDMGFTHHDQDVVGSLDQQSAPFRSPRRSKQQHKRGKSTGGAGAGDGDHGGGVGGEAVGAGGGGGGIGGGGGGAGGAGGGVSPTSTAFFAEMSASMKAKLKETHRMRAGLLAILVEMLLFELHSEEQSSKVWVAAFKCLMFFTAKKNGNIDKKQVAMVDIRVFTTMFDHTTDAVSKRELMRIIVNHLYSMNPYINTLNMARLDSIGGIDKILYFMTQTTSAQALNNLFVVVFDFVLSRMEAKQPKHFNDKEIEQLSLLLHVLSYTGFAYVLSRLIHASPEGLTEKLMHTFLKDVVSDDVLQRLDQRLCLYFFNELERILLEYNALNAEFASIVAQQVAQLRVVDAAGFDVLDSLLRSPQHKNRMNGVVWLFRLLVAIRESHARSNAMQKRINSVFTRLLKSGRVEVQMTYLMVLEKLVFYFANQMQTFAAESKLTEVFVIVNLYLGRLSRYEVRDVGVLLYSLNVLFQLTIVRRRGMPVLRHDAMDDTASLLLNGSLTLSADLLKRVDITIIKHIFEFLPPSHDEVRSILLFMMIFLCRNSEEVLDELGGIAFFKRLLAERNPNIAFLASNYLMEMFEVEKPEVYLAILPQLINKARETNNEKLVANPYLQIKTILALTH